VERRLRGSRGSPCAALRSGQGIRLPRLPPPDSHRHRPLRGCARRRTGPAPPLAQGVLGPAPTSGAPKRDQLEARRALPPRVLGRESGSRSSKFAPNLRNWAREYARHGRNRAQGSSTGRGDTPGMAELAPKADDRPSGSESSSQNRRYVLVEVLCAQIEARRLYVLTQSTDWRQNRARNRRSVFVRVLELPVELIGRGGRGDCTRTLLRRPRCARR
jgi:hypothetical protein